MSGYRVHALSYMVFISVLLCVLSFLGFQAPVSSLLPAFFVGFFYSLLPDVDVDRSMVRRFFVFCLLVCLGLFFFSDVFFFALAGVVLGFFLFVSFFVRHRGFFHSFSAAVLFSLPLYFLDPVLFFFGFFGFLTHLAVDGRFFSLF
ncbi:MAG: metal-dependent hydrolase [Candidatus Altiarchaeota archaeon]|nr:metal-dependent hydrolase [Candidatus Altiarchaeota archaeon]